MTTLRERRRAELTDRILDAAQEQLAQSGPAALSLRAVAREVGVAVSALYRYHPSRDDLLTALIVRAFEDHADAVETALQDAAAEPVSAWRAGLLAYRRWGVANPAPFGLAYGTPVPGYQAPAERTVAAGARCGDLLIGAAAQAWSAGAIASADVADWDAHLAPARRRHLTALAERRDYRLPIGLLAAVTDLSVPVHGFVVMEVFGQLRPLSDDPERDFGDLIDRELRRLGVGRGPNR